MRKCAYCNQEIREPVPTVLGDGTVITCCCDGCKDKALAFFRFFEKYKYLFFSGLILALGLIFAGVFIEIFTGSLQLLAVFIACGFAALGLVCLLFPFATPETFSLWGVRKTALIVRIIGAVMILASPLLALFIIS
jgi:hypothetical protein